MEPGYLVATPPRSAMSPARIMSPATQPGRARPARSRRAWRAAEREGNRAQGRKSMQRQFPGVGDERGEPGGFVPTRLQRAQITIPPAFHLSSAQWTVAGSEQTSL